MSGSSDESADAPRPSGLSYVTVGRRTNFDYEVGFLTVGEPTARRSIAIILVTEFEDRVVVALPQKAWNKTVAKRVMQPGPFTKALQVEVTRAASLEARDQAGAGTMKIWVGLLSRAIAEQVVFDSESGPDIVFVNPQGEACLPYAEALARVANEHFAFWSPNEGSDDRIAALERSVKELASTVQSLVPKAPMESRPKAKPAAATTRPRDEPGSVPGTPVPRGTAKGFSGLDPAVVQAAVQSGISPGELQEVKRMLGHQGGRLHDFPQGGAGAGLSPRGSQAEADEELDGELADAAAAEPSGTPIEAALVTLTSIVKELAGKRKAEKEKTWDTVLEGLEGFPSVDGSSSSSSGSRSKAAALRALKSSLRLHPEQIYEAVEALMEEDLLNRRSSGGLAGSVASARSWLEHRSRLGPYANSIRLGWAIAGIWDCLREQKYQEARARAALAIAALDQQSLDAGSWLIAQEVMLEPPPPLSSFTARRVQQLDPLESFHSKLLDPRMADLLLHRVKEVEGYMEAKKKLGKARVSDPPRGGDEAPTSAAEAKGRKGKEGKADKSGKPLRGPGAVGLLEPC